VKPALVIVGLGNPGDSYTRTRHNAGFRALDVLAQEWGEGEFVRKDTFESEILEGRIVTFPILLVKPQTFMNLSGDAVRKILDFYQLDPTKQLLVLSDDIDIELGDVRLRESGSAGTHNGLKSIVDQVGEEFPRLRIGIGPNPPTHDLSAWVLSRFSEEEEQKLGDILKGIPQKIHDFVLGDSSNT
jgi:peptidyl-tRNA hydrolase, PTH1 family